MSAKRTLERVVGKAWPARRLPRVLYYHSIHPEHALSHPPEAFDAQLRWLADEGYTFLTFAAASARLLRDDLPARTAVITFDDGYADNYSHALPILEKHGVPATFFVVSGIIASAPTPSNAGDRLYPDRDMLSRSQLRGLAAAGMEIGSHTRSHVHVQNALAADPSVEERELLGSRKDLEAILDAPVVSFAYPNGQRGVYSPATRAALARSGYRYAATTMWGALAVDADPLELPRIEIRHEDSLDVFAKKLEGRYDFMGPYARLSDRSRNW